MMPCVIAHCVPFFAHSFDQFGFGFYVSPNYEKSGGYVVFFQGVKYLPGITVFVPAVKGEIKNFLICIPGVVGIILRQLFKACVGGRRLSAFLEAQPPVSFS